MQELPLNIPGAESISGESRTNTSIESVKAIARRRFEDEVYKPFLRAAPTRLAIEAGQLSTAHPLRYLMKAKWLAAQRYTESELQLPQEIVEIQELQDLNGQWQPSRRLHLALGGRIPAPPEGVKGWLWATALVIIYLRRRPDLFELVYNTYSRGIEWVDENILAKAHARLPPDNLYYPVDDEAVRDGRWQESVACALEECGYAYFNQVSPDNNTLSEENEDDQGKTFTSSVEPEAPVRSVKDTHGNTPQKHINSGGQIGAAKHAGQGQSKCRHIPNLRTEEDEQAYGLSVEMHQASCQARKCFKKGDRVECRWRQPTRLDHPRVDPVVWHPATVKRTHKDGCVDVVFESGGCEKLSWVLPEHVRFAPRPAPAGSTPAGGEDITIARPSTSLRELAHITNTVHALRNNWKDSLPMSEELERLRGLCRRKQAARQPEWQSTFPAIQFEASKRLSLGQWKQGPRSRNPAQRRCTWQWHKANDSTPGQGVRRRNMLQLHPVDNQERPEVNAEEYSGIHEREGEDPRSSDIDQAQADLIRKVMAYERCLRSVKDCLSRGLVAYRTSHTYSEQQRAFEETTANLGFFQPARAGYSDWHGHDVVGLQNATLDAIEAVGMWAQARASAVRDVGEGGRVLPFLWEGKNFLVGIIDQMDSFFKGAPELQRWYGPGFPLKRNPFCMAYNLDERPATPRSAMVRSYIHGECVMAISPSLLHDREKEEEALKAITDRQRGAPSWWPGKGMDEKHFQRIRAAEKVVLREEQVVGQSASCLAPPAAFGSKRIS